MEIWKLILTFLKIGAVSFGGGWTVVGLIHDEVLAAGLMSEMAFTEAVAIAQLTPGPVALNMATLSGYRSAGLLGAFVATLAVIAVPLASMILVGILATRIRWLSRERLGESLKIGALAMTGMTAWSLSFSDGFSWRIILFSVISFLASAFTRIHPALLILSCGALNLGLGLILRAI